MTARPTQCACTTCGDAAVEMVAIAYDARADLARCVDRDGDLADVDAGLVDGVAPGTRLLVHAGTAIALAPAPPTPGATR